MKVAQLCPTLRPHGLYSPRNSPGQNTGVGSCSLLQGIFPTQGWLKPGLLHCRQILYQLSHQGSRYKINIKLRLIFMKFMAPTMAKNPSFSEVTWGNSQVFQWLGLHASTAGGPGSIYTKACAFSVNHWTWGAVLGTPDQETICSKYSKQLSLKIKYITVGSTHPDSYII